MTEINKALEDFKQSRLSSFEYWMKKYADLVDKIKRIENGELVKQEIDLNLPNIPKYIELDRRFTPLLKKLKKEAAQKLGEFLFEVKRDQKKAMECQLVYEMMKDLEEEFLKRISEIGKII